ncbi:hypothetical protein L3X38_032964 [Prunus dulcis]|uniref:Ubiquitin-like protease family profile domain-containing protein n=1 Tax=Prunus dulcis TaxID=3755 RepID=A0AAD4VG65_PRUDU|nr:hypothetical protein L3X38_032964 [Prunus dulcis]
MPSFQCLQQFLEPVKGPAKKRGSKKAASSNIVDLPPSNLNNIHHYVRGSHWVAIEIDFVRHTATVYDSYIAFTFTSKLVKYLHPISDTLARVLYEMHFYDAFEVEEVKQKGMKMSTFTPFTVCSIGDVPQQCCSSNLVQFIDTSNFRTYWPDIQFSIVFSSSPPQSSPTPSPQPATDSPSPKTPSPIPLPPSPSGAPVNAPYPYSISVGRQHASSFFSSAVESKLRQPQQAQAETELRTPLE